MSPLRHWSQVYIRRTWLIGFLYSAVPVCAWFLWVALNYEFRAVYVLRLVIALAVGGGMGSWVHTRAINLWLARHRSPQGPISILDGALLGAGVGVAASFAPPLTALIASHHVELAKSFIIASWVAGPIAGAIIGAILTSIGRSHIERTLPSPRGE